MTIDVIMNFVLPLSVGFPVNNPTPFIKMFSKEDLGTLQNYVRGLGERYQNAYLVRDDSQQLDAGERAALIKLKQYYQEKGGQKIDDDEFYLYDLRTNVYRDLHKWLDRIREDIKAIDDEAHAVLFERTPLVNMTGQQLQNVLLDTLRRAKLEGLI